jgi:hypothetical protein
VGIKLLPKQDNRTRNFLILTVVAVVLVVLALILNAALEPGRQAAYATMEGIETFVRLTLAAQ